MHHYSVPPLQFLLNCPDSHHSFQVQKNNNTYVLPLIDPQIIALYHCINQSLYFDLPALE